MIERIKNILISPKAEWAKIKTEPAGIAQVFTGYAIPLALIPAVFGFLGRALIGINLGILGTFRIPFAYAIAWAIVYYVLTLVALYVFALVVNALAPSFGSKPDMVKAFKLVVYSMTPGWIAGVLQIFPLLALLMFLAGLYGLYILYLGFEPMMETPKDKVVVYLIVSIVIYIVVYFVVSAIAGLVLNMAWRPMIRF
jgi:Yip1 domain